MTPTLPADLLRLILECAETATTLEGAWLPNVFAHDLRVHLSRLSTPAAEAPAMEAVDKIGLACKHGMEPGMCPYCAVKGTAPKPTDGQGSFSDERETAPPAPKAGTGELQEVIDKIAMAMGHVVDRNVTYWETAERLAKVAAIARTVRSKIQQLAGKTGTIAWYHADLFEALRALDGHAPETAAPAVSVAQLTVTELREIEDTLSVAPIPADGKAVFEDWDRSKRKPALALIERALMPPTVPGDGRGDQK